MRKYKRLQGQEWYDLKDKSIKMGTSKVFILMMEHWLNNEEIIVLKESGE